MIQIIISLSSDIVFRNSGTGAWSNPLTADSNKQILHFGCFPGNLQNWASNFKTLVGLGTIQGGYITVEAQKQNTMKYLRLTLLNLIALMEKGMNL
jgi:hypothetical protein